MDDFRGIAITIGLIVLFVLFVLCNPIAIVNVGQRGVKVTLGKVSPESFTEGVHFVTPFISHIVTMDVKTQKSNIITQTYTKDLQQARINYVVTYNLQANNVHKMFREVGKDYKETILNPVVEGTVKDVIGSFNANDLVGNRNIVTNDILAKLQKQLSKNFIDVTDFQITNINYNETFEKAVEAKVQAEQEALQAKNITIKTAEEAKQKVITAEAEARAIKIQAQALNRNRELVQLESVKKWDGKLPTYMMGNSVPFINMNTK